MVGAKSTQTKVIRDNHRQGASYNLFSHNKSFQENVKRCILSVIIPTALVCVLFAPYHPYLLFNIFSCFFIFKLRVMCVYNDQISNVRLLVLRGVVSE